MKETQTAKKKICFITAARSEYGLLKWLMSDVQNSDCFQLQLVVTGAHLLQEQGHTIDHIQQDGFVPDAIVDVALDATTPKTIAESMGRMGEQFADTFEQLQPDYVAVLGDRYELLPIVNTAFVMGIPVIHIGGGDVTEGAIDDGIRNAITMLAAYHFPGTQESAERIIRMRGSEQNVWTVGEPGLDAFYREELLTREQLAQNLQLEETSKWVLLTYHPETHLDLQANLDALQNILTALKQMDGYQVVVTYANADFGGKEINERLEDVGREYPQKFRVIPSLGHIRYLSFLKQADFVIGNSSSGILEAPLMQVPVVNIGNRQTGRHQCSNIVQSASSLQEIQNAIQKALQMKAEQTDANYWGDGKTSVRILRILEETLK